MIRRILHVLAAAVLASFALAAAAADKIEVLWLGHSAFRITSLDGKVILVDPFITQNPKTPAKWKNLDELGRIDVILVTHAHGDHLGDAPDLAKKLKAPLYAPAGLNQSLTALGIVPAELAPRMNKSGTVKPLGDRIRITMVRAEHSSELAWKNPASGKDEVHVGGEPVGFVIEFENGFKIYHMGDTGLFGDMKMIGDRYRPDLVLIPIGGHFVMGPEDAAYATTMLSARHAIPIHYGTNPMLKGTPEEYMRALGNAPVKVHALQPGDRVSF